MRGYLIVLAAASLAVAASSAASGCGGDAEVGGGTGGAQTGGNGGAPTGGSGGTGQGGDGGSGGQCGDPAALAQYPACVQADDETSCEAAGGTWTTVGLAPGPECQCPTGQGDCPCTKPSQCLTGCIAPPVDGVFDCTGVVEGLCSPVSITVGCWCIFDESGVPTGYCID